MKVFQSQLQFPYHMLFFSVSYKKPHSYLGKSPFFIRKNCLVRLSSIFPIFIKLPPPNFENPFFNKDACPTPL
ncbi:hypothetical protein CW304_12385 [Bacillus sp. UFRGS-B20]|nr:hypothetical protein CW304_12385 [Bacillus sp. UFRGS-B20]